jgi:hypothetical protein
MSDEYDSSLVNAAAVNEEGISYNVLRRQPETVNAFQNTNFKFTLTRIPNVTFWCSSVNIPQISIGEVTVQTGMLPHHVPGSSIQLDPLRVNFAVDEEFANWNEIYRWMRSIVPFEDFTEILSNENNYYSEGTIHCLNSAKNPNKRFVFKKLFPVSLDGFDLNVALNEPEPVTVSATFTYESFEIENVT